MKRLTIRLLQKFTSAIQLKGVPRLILLIKNGLLKANTQYMVYNNIKLTIDPSVSFHCLNVMNYGGYETIKIFETYLQKGDVYVDIGTNLGYMSLNAEKIVGPGGTVISFEPDSRILPILKENKRINNSSINIIEKAVSDQPGEAIFNIAKESGLSRLSNAGNNLFGMELLEQKKVEMNSLDNILQEVIPGKPVKMIKIDVEGHELRVLKGAEDTLKKYTPHLILEINHPAMAQNNVTYLDILHYLEQFSYSFYFIDPHSADWLRFGRKPTFKPIKTYHEKFIQQPFDLLCVRSGIPV